MLALQRIENESGIVEKLTGTGVNYSVKPSDLRKKLKAQRYKGNELTRMVNDAVFGRNS